MFRVQKSTGWTLLEQRPVKSKVICHQFTTKFSLKTNIFSISTATVEFPVKKSR